ALMKETKPVSEPSVHIRQFMAGVNKLSTLAISRISCIPL
ncbi:12873_t:CDS:1, partial [Gigaspora rosea]